MSPLNQFKSLKKKDNHSNLQSSMMQQNENDIRASETQKNYQN